MTRSTVSCVFVCALLVLVSGCASSPPVTISLTPTSAMLFSTQSVQLTATDSRGSTDVVWTVPGTSGASVDATGNFTAPTVSAITAVTVTATSHHDPTKMATATITVLPSGQVTPTNNPQVATYSLKLPPGTNAYIQFSRDSSYNLKTWTVPTPPSGLLSIFVAGMLASTQYHMQAVLPGANGSTVTDLDHVFTTQAVPAAQNPVVTAMTVQGMTPQSGVELLDLIQSGGPGPIAVVDLAGNLLWSYPKFASGATIQGVHLLPNGHFLFAATPDKFGGTLLEVDLAGNTIQSETGQQLQAGLTKLGLNYTLYRFHHDVIALPNGHWIGLFNMDVPCSNIPNCSGQTSVLGDVIVDLAPQGDGTFSPVWTWSTFDHLDINRAPQGYPDWTHSNALVYSPDDGNLLLSIRHLSWIVKIDYENGKGSGDIIWRLGYQGDFTLEGGTDPYDWFYMQHGPSFTTTNTTGQFGLAVFDNGNDRPVPSGTTCTAPSCPYSRGMVLQIDEQSMTANIVSDYQPGEYSFWGGNAEQLANGNLEANFNAGSPAGFSDIFELTPGANPQVVWTLRTGNGNAYRGYRMTSLYPGVQW